MFPGIEYIKTCLNGLRSRIEKVESWFVSNRPNWAQNDPDALDYVKGRTHYEANGEVVQLHPKFLPPPTSNTAGAIKADTVKTTDIQPVRLGTDGKLYSSGVPIFTTSGNGKAYTANVPEITELVNGMLVVMIPHVQSIADSQTLNINGLGAYPIRRFDSATNSSIQKLYYQNWLKDNVPVLLIYWSGYWFACSFTKPNAYDLNGITSVVNGGTGRQTLSKGSYIIGNGTSSVQQKTPSEVLADIGAIPAPATASVGQAIVVKAVDKTGKPTAWEPVDMPTGGGERTFEKVVEMTTAEDAAVISISTDKNGNPLSMSEFYVAITTARNSEATKNNNFNCNVLPDTVPSYIRTKSAIKSLMMFQDVYCYVMHYKVVGGMIFYEYTGRVRTSSGLNVANYLENEKNIGIILSSGETTGFLSPSDAGNGESKIDSAGKMYCITFGADSTECIFGAGTRVEVWAR